jgi:hypothetical protein
VARRCLDQRVASRTANENHRSRSVHRSDLDRRRSPALGSNPTSSASATSSSAERDGLPNGAVEPRRGHRWTAGEVAASTTRAAPRSRSMAADPHPRVIREEDDRRLLRPDFDRVGSDLGYLAVDEVVEVAGRDA